MSFGITLGLIPVSWISFVILASLYIVFSTVIKINPASKRSVVVYALFFVINCTVLGATGCFFTAIGCGMLSLLPIVKFLFSKNGMVENTFDCELSDGCEENK